MQHNRKGTLGEDMTVTRLLARGYAVVGRNVRPPQRGYGASELDIIAVKDRSISFIEVKFHRHFLYESITPRQCRRIAAAAAWYLGEHPEYAAYDVSLDAAFVRPDRSIDYRANAWLAEA
jgi:putative endonuclease